uniref:Uncharacterized protein n=1 Tax=Chlamydomonas leiostraca TaxID=1034604 RepID=A0A7S0RIY5_9CHLO
MVSPTFPTGPMSLRQQPAAAGPAGPPASGAYQPLAAGIQFGSYTPPMPAPTPSYAPTGGSSYAPALRQASSGGMAGGAGPAPETSGSSSSNGHSSHSRYAPPLGGGGGSAAGRSAASSSSAAASGTGSTPLQHIKDMDGEQRKAWLRAELARRREPSAAGASSGAALAQARAAGQGPLVQGPAPVQRQVVQIAALLQLQGKHPRKRG